MKHFTASRRFYIDVRRYDRNDELSYDLSQHLPRRLPVGPVIVVTDNPPIFLSVIRKRLARVRDDVEREHARTLDRNKKMGFNRELHRLRTARFTTKPQTLVANPDVLFATPYALMGRWLQCSTLYITTALSASELQASLRMLASGGLLVVYGDWLPYYGAVLAKYRMV